MKGLSCSVANNQVCMMPVRGRFDGLDYLRAEINVVIRELKLMWSLFKV